VKRISLQNLLQAAAKSEMENSSIASFNLYFNIHETSGTNSFDYIFEGISAINITDPD